MPGRAASSRPGPATAADTSSVDQPRLTFVIEQPRLDVEPGGEAGELAAGTDHPVARHDDAERVLAVRGADGAGLVGIAEAAGLLRRS